VEEQAVKDRADAYRKAMDEGKTVVQVDNAKSSYAFTVHWESYMGKQWTEKANTAVPLKHIKELAIQMENLPDGFVVQAQVKKTLDAHKKMTTEELPINWGYAEIMAYATLLDEGFPIRLCGQDVGRGTFAH